MGKRLFAPKTGTLTARRKEISNLTRANQNKKDDLKSTLDNADAYQTLQLAAEAFSKNLASTYEKDLGALKSSLQILNHTLLDKPDERLQDPKIKKEINYLYTGEENEALTGNWAKSASNGLASYFTDITNVDNLELTKQTPENAKILQTFVEALAKHWRSMKQNLKKQAKPELSKINKVCKTAETYEQWFQTNATQNLIGLSAKKLTKLQQQAETKWEKYDTFINDNKQYLLDAYKTNTFYKTAREHYDKLTQQNPTTP